MKKENKETKANKVLAIEYKEKSAQKPALTSPEKALINMIKPSSSKENYRIRPKPYTIPVKDKKPDPSPTLVSKSPKQLKMSKNQFKNSKNPHFVKRSRISGVGRKRKTIALPIKNSKKERLNRAVAYLSPQDLNAIASFKRKPEKTGNNPNKKFAKNKEYKLWFE